MATEATRNAINRDELLRRMKEEVGWGVQLLSKEEEARLGAMGIASSVAFLDGICMDMGGGSVQLTWVRKKTDGSIDMGPSVSFPYGAAALMSRLQKMSNSEDSWPLLSEMAGNIQTVFEEDLQIPKAQWQAAERSGGFNLYLSGGGFRGWGHILMSSENVQPYPIPIINGYSVLRSQFFTPMESQPINLTNSRLSARRISQVPAVEALVKAIKQTRLPVLRVTFAQGGVREGLLYSTLSSSIRAQHPLITSTLQYTPHSRTKLTALLRKSLPCPLGPELLEATVNLLYVHGSLAKDIRAAAALRCTTTGVLAGTHGLSHDDRRLLALILCERWGADISDNDVAFLQSLQSLSGPMAWWAKFVGRLAKGVADIFPAGVVRHNEEMIGVEAGFPPGKDASSADSCVIKIALLREDITHIVDAWAKDLEKLGKRKNWVHGGIKVNVEVNKPAA